MADPLVMDFARRYPAEVAAMISREPIDEVVALLRALPHDAAVAVLPIVPGSQLGRIIETLGDAETARWLDDAGFDPAVAVLLRLRAERRAPILAAMPTRRRRLAVEARFAWPEGTLGALASRRLVTVPAGATLRDVAAELAALPDAAADDDVTIHVLDTGGQLRGEVDLRRALESEDRDLPVERCLQRVDGLAADTPIASAVKAPVWRRLARVPVVDRENRLVGTVTHAQLREAVATVDATAEAFETVSDLATNFLDVLGSLAALAFGGAPRAERGPRRAEDRS